MAFLLVVTCIMCLGLTVFGLGLLLTDGGGSQEPGAVAVAGLFGFLFAVCGASGCFFSAAHLYRVLS